MANAIATVVSLSGQAWAKTPDGTLRPLKVGDVLAPQEVVITAKDARIELDFGDGRPVVIAAGQEVALSPDLWTDLASTPKDAALQSASVEEALTVLNNGGDLSDKLDPTAAGLNGAGGTDEGHGFVQLTRVVESTSGQTFSFATTAAADTTAIADFIAPLVDPTIITAGEGAVKEDENTSTGGQLQITDPDLGEAAFQPQTATAGNYGSFSIDADGNWNYELNNDDPAVQGLAEGATLPSEVFTVTSVDGTSQTVTVSITGTNDIASIIPEPTMSAPGGGGPLARNDQGAVKEDVVLTTSGRLLVSDADIGEAIFQVQTAVAGAHGTFSIDEDGRWIYELNNADPAVQALKEGEKLPPEIFTTLSSDGTASHQVTVAITGTNDIAVITAVAGSSDTGLVKEDVVLTTGGQLKVTDVDTGEAAFQVQNAIPGAHGSFSIDTTGKWSYQLNNADPAVQALSEGATLPNEIFTVKSIDGSTHKVTVTITGTNDAAVITAAAGSSDKGAVKEDVVLTTGGQLKVTDVDTGEAAFQVQNAIPGAHGSFSIDATGKWSYQLNNADPAVQALSEGATLPNEIFTVKSIDGSTHNVTVTITGTNDAAVITVAAGSSDKGAVKEDVVLTTGGQLKVTDVDTGEAAFQVQNAIPGAHGSFSIDATGKWSYQLNNADPVVQALSEGATLPNEIFTVKSIDGATHNVTVTITGTNDAAVITAAAGSSDKGAVKEDITVTAVGQLKVTDVDTGEAAFQVQNNIAGAHGIFSIDKNGNWKYQLNNGDPAVQALSEGAKLPDEVFTVKSTDGTTHSVTVIITGTNDIPVANADSGFGTVKNTQMILLPSQLLLNDTDLDGDALTIVSVHGATHGSVALNNLGQVVFTPDNQYTGPASFTYTIDDNHGGRSTASVNLDVGRVNEAPVAVDDPGKAVVKTVGLHGEYYSYFEGPNGLNLTNLDQAETFIANHGANATFVATNLDYGDASIRTSLGMGNNLELFLRGDKASLSNAHPGSSDAIIRMSGAIELAAGTHNFRVYGDDGYQIKIDGVIVAQFNGNQAPTTNVHNDFTVATSGSHRVEILYWDQGVQAVLKVEISSDKGATYSVLSSQTTTHVSAYLINEDESWTVSAADLLANDSDPDADTLSIISVQNAINGTATLNSNGSVTFKPTANFSGSASYTYTVSDGHGGTDTATVSIDVLSVNDAPVASNDILIAAKNTAAAGSNQFAITIPQSDLLVNDKDIDGNKLSIKSVQDLPNGASNGYSWMTASGEVMFLPMVGFTGDASFKYTITDNFGGTSEATAVVKVATINGNDSANVLSGTSGAGEVIAGLGGNDTVVALSGNDFIDGGAGNDSINGGGGNDLLKGGSGSDSLEGGIGDDKLIGGLDNDQLNGGAGNDVLEGSIGNDYLTGGAGADTFVWHLVDKGTKTLPAADTVSDFTVGAGGDTLDLRDLLQNENSGNLTEYLHFTASGGNTTISISSAGDFNGSNFATATDQTIILSGVDLTTMGTDTDIINQLKNNANLITD